MDDDALMRRVAGGDIAAFGCLVKAHRARLTRFAARMLSDREAAQDVVQEAFLRLWRLRSRYQPQQNLEGLLLRIVRNLCLDEARAARPIEIREDDLAGGCGESIEGRYQQQALADAVRRAVRSLPEPQREVFILSQYEGLSYREIAELLDCPVNTVASRKHLAVESLRRRLGGWIEGEAGSREKKDELR